MYACVKKKVIGQTQVRLRIGNRGVDDYGFSILSNNLDFDIRALIIASSKNLESGPQFAGVCSKLNIRKKLQV